MEFIAPLPFTEALDKLGRKDVITSPLTSAEWSDVPVALRDRAFFSSRVESARFLQRGQDAINDFLAGNREVLPDGQSALKVGGRARFVELMRELAIKEGMGNVDPKDRGGIKDITSQKRLDLIFSVQVKQAHGYGYHKQGMDPDVLDAYPAQRFIRVQEVQEPRDWHAQFEGRAYLKTSPIWAAINQQFGVAWPPFGFNCGHDVEDVDRDEAEAEGLLRPGEAVTPPPAEDFNQDLKASTDGLDPELIQKMKSAFEDQVVFEGDTMRWQPRPVVDPVQPTRANPVSAAIQPKVYGALKTQVQIATEAADSVHDDGVLPKIPLKQSTDPSDQAHLMPRRDQDGNTRADYIAVRADGPTPAFTTLHELGHLLDLEGIGAKGSWASNTGELREVLEAARKTRAVAGLESERAGGAGRSAEQLEYLLSDREVWARAYSQYIAERSRSKPLKTQLKVELAREANAQWESDDFAPIAQAIDNLFTTLRWI